MDMMQNFFTLFSLYIFIPISPQNQVPKQIQDPSLNQIKVH
jgi:hypothetical protein